MFSLKFWTQALIEVVAAIAADPIMLAPIICVFALALIVFGVAWAFVH